jgi:quinolinate synthase
MADIEQVENAWKALKSSEDIVPVTYINSSAELKAFCGKHGGIVCTSSNAGKAFDWALKQKGKIFFFPDEHLGRNTANAKGFKRNEIAVWDPYAAPSPLVGEGQGEGAKVILWKGYCHVHTYFMVEHVKHAREKYPGCKVVVHPECPEEVVGAADANGSTSFLKKYAEDAKAGSTVVIGTEINLVNRLARQNPDKKIVPLARSLCPNMFKTSLADLCYVLENLPQVNEVTVPAYIIDDAKVALERMLTLG